MFICLENVTCIKKLPTLSAVIKTGLSKALQKRLPFCKLRVIFKSTKVTLTLNMFHQNLYDHAKYTNLHAEAAALPIMAKPFDILK